MKLRTEPYLTALKHWPTTGKHILAQFDDTQIVVYQAYRPEIANYAAQHGRFGDGFSFKWLAGTASGIRGKHPNAFHFPRQPLLATRFTRGSNRAYPVLHPPVT